MVVGSGSRSICGVRVRTWDECLKVGDSVFWQRAMTWRLDRVWARFCPSRQGGQGEGGGNFGELEMEVEWCMVCSRGPQERSKYILSPRLVTLGKGQGVDEAE
ncbi:hypothetical protein Salat_2139200 [Sesamum alatum]|uniref:Uncharacterized protein n=1 Tax=Sesamum alatum TaxID=300844 RepID=A0AAE1Y161_9LAMI|nr:hypothetical protein Salat_2139200 [Sesamum alatum]